MYPLGGYWSSGAAVATHGAGNLLRVKPPFRGLDREKSAAPFPCLKPWIRFKQEFQRSCRQVGMRT